MIQRMLNASQTLCRIIVFVVNMNVIMCHSITHIFRQQIIIHKGFRCFRSKLHHHSGRSVCIHIGIFACHIIILDVHNLHKHVTGLGFSCDASLIAIGNILLCYILSSTLHELHFNGILNFLHGHLTLAMNANVVCNLLYECVILTLFGVHHGLSDGCHDFLFVETDYSSVSFYYGLYHYFIGEYGLKFICKDSI